MFKKVFNQRFLLTVFFLFSLTISVFSIQIEHQVIGNVEIGMNPGTKCIVKVTNNDAITYPTGSSLTITQPAGMKLLTPVGNYSLGYYRNNVKVTTTYLIYNGAKVLTLNAPFAPGEYYVFEYLMQAGNQVYLLDTEEKEYKDNLTFKSGTTVISFQSNTYNVTYPVFIMTSNPNPYTVEWNKTFVDNFKIRNTGDGSIDKIYLDVNVGTSDIIRFEPGSYISNPSNPEKRFIFKTLPTYSGGKYRFIITKAELDSIDINPENLFKADQEIDFNAIFRVSRTVPANYSILYNVSWDNEPTTGEIRIESHTRKQDINPTQDPVATTKASTTFIQVTKPTPCGNGYLKAEATFEIKNVSVENISISNILDITLQIRNSVGIRIDSLKIGDVKLDSIKNYMYNPNIMIYTFSMPTFKVNNEEGVGLESIHSLLNIKTPIYNDLAPGNFVRFKVYYTYPDLTDSPFLGIQQFLSFGWTALYNTSGATQGKIAGSTVDMTENEPNLQFSTTGATDNYVGQPQDYTLTNLNPATTIYHTILNCDEKKWIQKCKIPKGFVLNSSQLQYLKSGVWTADPKQPTKTISGDISTGYEITWVSETNVNFISKRFALNLTPVCSASAESVIEWKTFYKCNSCQDENSLRNVTVNNWVANVIPVDSCGPQTPVGGAEFGFGLDTYPTSVSLERKTYGYYDENKTLDSWTTSDLAESKKIIYESSMYNSLLSNKSINNKLAFTQDSVCANVVGNINLSTISGQPDTLETVFVYQAPYALLKHSRAEFLMNSKTYHIPSELITESNLDSIYIYKIKFPKSLLAADTFAVGQVKVKLYAQILDSAAIINYPRIISFFRASFNAIYNDKVGFGTRSLGDKVNFTIYKWNIPNVISGAFSSTNWNSYFGHQVGLDEITTTSLLDNSNIYDKFIKEFRYMGSLDSIVVSAPVGYSVDSIQTLNNKGKITSIRQIGTKTFISGDFPIGKGLKGFRVLYYLSSSCGNEGKTSDSIWVYHKKYNYTELPKDSLWRVRQSIYGQGIVTITPKVESYIVNSGLKWSIDFKHSVGTKNCIWMQITLPKNNRAFVKDIKVQDQNGLYLDRVLNGNDFYFAVGPLDNKAYKYTITASVDSCINMNIQDTLKVNTGWSVDKNTPIEAICMNTTSTKTNLLVFNNSTSWMRGATLDAPNKRFGLCELIGVSTYIKSADIGDISRLGFQFVSKDSLLELVGNQISYSYKNNSGTFNSDSLFADNTIISSTLLSKHNVPDSYVYTGDSIKLHFNLRVNCVNNQQPDLDKIGRLMFKTQGYTKCGTKLGSNIYGFNLNFKGFELADNLSATATASDFGVKAGSADMEISVSNVGTTKSDSVFVETFLPAGIQYISSTVANPTLRDSIGGTLVKWQLSLDAASSVKIGVTIKDNGVCAPSSVSLPVRAYMLRSIGGCSSTCLFQKTFAETTVNVAVPEAAKISIETQQTVCAGAQVFSVNIPTQNVASTVWNYSPAESGVLNKVSDTELQFVLDPAFTGTVTIETNSNYVACEVADSIKKTTIIVNPAVRLLLTSPAAVCSPSVVDLTQAAITAGSTDGLQFSYWLNEDATIELANPKAVSQSGTYFIKGVNSFGCSAIASIAVVVNAQPIIDVVNPAAVCSPSAVNITAAQVLNNYDSFLTYSYWLNAQATEQLTEPNAVSVSGTYYIQATNLLGCSVVKPVSVVVNALPIVTIATSTPSICAGATASLSASGAESFVWLTGETTSSISVSPSSTTVYTVKGTNASGCVSSASQEVVVKALPIVTIATSTSSICAGTTANLSASGAESFVWSTGETASSISVSPSSTTVYTVQGTNASGCVSSANQEVVVNALPIVSIATSTPSICAGATASLGASGAESFVWSTGETTSNISVTPSSTTVYTVQGTNASGCVSSASQEVIVNALPIVSIATSTSSICAGATASLSASGAESFVWSTGETSSNISVNPSSTTVYTVEGTNASGCVSSASQEVIVNALPTVAIATSTPSICAGASASLSASGAESFVWSTGETTSNISVTPSSTTVYTVEGTNASGCVSSASQEVIVTALPIVAITPSETSICKGASASLQASGAATYSWSTGETASSITVSPTASAVYTVTGTDANACVASASVELTVTECGTPCKVNAGADITVCAGTAVSLNAVASDCLLGTVSGCAAAVSSPYTCSSNPINAYNQNLTLNSGDVVYVGNYSGNIQMNGGTMVICGDNISLPYLNINGSGAGEIVVNGTVNFNNININNQNLTLKNYGTCNFLNNTCNAAIENYGVMNFAIDFETKKSFYNGGTINALASFNSRAKIVNEGKLTVANVLHNNGGSDLKNTCTIQAYQFINDAKAENSGTIAVTTETILNGSSIYYSKAGSLLSMKTLMMNSNVTGDATGCSTLKITDGATINGGAKCTGMVTVCGITTTASTAFNSSVTYGCACAVGAPAGLTYVWTPSAGLSNANVANPTILNPQTTTTYKVEVTTASGEKVSDNVTVTVNDCTPEPVCSEKWDKSSLQVTGECQSGFVVFTIRNTGELGGGDMTCYSPVRVYVDGVLYVTDQVRLKGGESIEFKYEANASTWRLEADQHPAHPGKSRPNAVVEACGGSKIDSGCGGKKPVVAKSCGKGSKSNYSSDKGSSCSKRSAEVMFEEQLFTLELSVRPNPILTEGALVYIIPEGENATIRIYSQTGMLVAEYKALMSSGELSVSASELPSGIYIVELKASNGVSKQMKFTVK